MSKPSEIGIFVVLTSEASRVQVLWNIPAVIDPFFSKHNEAILVEDHRSTWYVPVTLHLYVVPNSFLARTKST